MRQWITILCVYVLAFGFIAVAGWYNYPQSIVYACADKENNPSDVQKLCERLTKGQWWNK